MKPNRLEQRVSFKHNGNIHCVQSNDFLSKLISIDFSLRKIRNKLRTQDLPATNQKCNTPEIYVNDTCPRGSDIKLYVEY